MPREPRNIAFLKRVSSLVYPVRTTIFLTSTDWGKLFREVQQLVGFASGRPVTWANFKKAPFVIGRLTAVNSGTEDQDVCDLLNAPEERKSQFREKHDCLAQRAGTKPEIEYTDAESTHAFPDDLARQVETKLRRKYGTPDIEVVP